LIEKEKSNLPFSAMVAVPRWEGVQAPTMVHPPAIFPVGQRPREPQTSALVKHCPSPPPQHHPAAKCSFSLIYTADGGAGLVDRSAAPGSVVPWVGAEGIRALQEGELRISKAEY